MKILEKIKQELEKTFEKLGYDKGDVVITFSDRPELCDLQCNSAFALAKKEKKAPIVIANQIKDNFKCKGVNIEIANPGFINIKLGKEFLNNTLKELFKDDRIGIEEEKNPKKIFIDYGGPNVAKPLHVGHLRSAIIGETIKRIAIFMGNEVISDVYLGDWGLQMGLTIANIMEKYDCEFYMSGNGKKPKITMTDLNVLYPEASQRSKIDEDFKRLAQEITVRLQKKEKPYYQIWQDIRQISVDQIKKEYQKLNVSFDLWNGESNAEPFVQKTFDILNSKKLIEKSEGAEIVKVEEESDTAPMPPVIVKSSAGAGLYATSDIATIVARMENVKPNQIWYITDNRQSMHFEQVFRVCEKAGIATKKQLQHFGFGTMNGVDGKPFKTRDGGTMSLSTLIDTINLACKDKLNESQKVEDLSEEEKQLLAEKIGLSAIKFGDMINYRAKDYVFDIPKFCSFEGKTGPYMLYSIVRINSILSKCDFVPTFDIQNDIEKEIIINLLKFAVDVKSSYDEKAPNIMVQSAYSLASSFSTLYNQTKIISETNKNRKNTLITLLMTVKKALIIFANLLAIDVPEKM